MGLIGDLSEKSVIDIACGEGFYTRMLRQRGAKKVTGVDLSEGMIALARANEAQHQLGIEYVVGDGRALDLGTEYDLAVAAYLLNYAQDRAELGAMCRGIARCLRPGGRFVTVNANPALDFPAAPSYRKYEFTTAVVGAFPKGCLSHGPSFWEMGHLRSRITFSMSDVMRRRCARQGFGRSTGIAPGSRLRASRPKARISGRTSWNTRR